MSVATTAPTASVPAHALRRGTRGFAAVVLFLTGMIVSTLALIVLPASAIVPTALTFLVPLAITFSIAHFVAVYGVIRCRAWVVPLALYLLAIGLGLVTFTVLLLRGGLDPLGSAAGVRADTATLLGLLAWLAGSWIVGARFVVRGMAPAERRVVEEPTPDVRRVVASHPRVVADASRRRTELQLGSA